MDADTAKLLRAMSAIIRDTAEQAYYAHQVAEKVHISCTHMVSGFAQCYESPFEPELKHIADSKSDLLRRLDALIAALPK